MPALIVSQASRGTIYYDLTVPPPVLHTAQPEAVTITPGSTWRHASVIDSYADGDLDLVLTYLREVIR
jgi:hypothetical protein